VKRLKGDSRPINSLEHRMAMLAALECVDWVVPFEEDTPREVIARLLPDILVKGGDYQSIDQIAGHDCVLANGGEVKLLGFVEGFSTTRLINKIAGSDFGQHNAGPSQGEGEPHGWGEHKIAGSDFGQHNAGPSQGKDEPQGWGEHKIAGSDFGRQNAGPSQGEDESREWDEPNIHNL
jgi:hypothetical protein